MESIVGCCANFTVVGKRVSADDVAVVARPIAVMLQSLDRRADGIQIDGRLWFQTMEASQSMEAAMKANRMVSRLGRAPGSGIPGPVVYQNNRPTPRHHPDEDHCPCEFTIDIEDVAPRWQVKRWT